MKRTLKKVSTATRKELAFLEALARRLPDDIDILKAMGDLYTQTGKYLEGLQTDLNLCRLSPDDAMVWYNLACSYALVDRKDEGIGAIERAVALGYEDYAWMSQDADLESLRNDPRFVAILQQLAQ